MKYLINDTYYHAYGGMIAKDGKVIGSYKRSNEDRHFYTARIHGTQATADRLGVALKYATEGNANDSFRC